MAELYFKTNIQLKSIIGKDLINDDNIAILELVKNSFDANAKRVDITYLNLKNNDDEKVAIFSNKTSRIILKDDGIGMDLYDIKNRWLNIAYSEKKTNTKQYNRLMAGAKGVGRFSCDRLGEYLNLYSKKTGSNEYILLSIDWKKFEIDDDTKEIQSVKLDYQILSESEFVNRGFELFDHGVLLEIIKLRSLWVYENNNSSGKTISWNTDKFSNLKKYLEKLINPNQAFEKNDFGIFFNAPEFLFENNNLQNHNKFIGKVENTIFDKLDFQCTSIESSIISDGTVIFTELKDKGQTIFWIKEKNDFFPLVKNAKISLYYLNPYAKAFFTKQTGIRSVDYGSIFLFINGFRIPPYGEVGNDWLGIDQRKAQGFARYIGLREFVGRIEILDYKNDFQIISSREGVVKNENYFALVNQEGNKSYFFRTLRKLEKYVVDGLNWDSIPEEDKDRISEIEKKIISGETKEDDLIYREDSTSKDKRIYESIHSIIGAKAENVIELYINENLILRKIDEEKANSEREFTQLLIDFENKKIDADVLNRILQKKAEENKELEKQLNEFSKYTTNEITTRALLEIQNYKSTIEFQSKIINELKDKLQIVENEIDLKTKEVEKYQKEIEDTKNELKEQVSQNLFLKSIKSQDFDEIVSFMHHAGIYAQTIDSYLKNISLKLNRGIPISNEDLTDIIKNISFASNKILNITEFATKAKFKLKTEKMDVDLVSYISEYITNIIPTVTDRKMKISFESLTKNVITKSIKPIEINILIDNLINNSIKAYADNLKVRLEDDSGKVILFFIDDGKGINPKYIDKIFDFGFTTTDGSGLGLYHIKQILTELNAEITVENNQQKGVTFKITI